MSSGRGFMERFHEIIAGWLRDVKLVFEVQGSINKFPICLGGLRNPGLATFVIHGGKGLGYNRVRHGGCRDIFYKGGINGSDVEVLVGSFQEGDFPVIIASFDLDLP